MHSRGRTQGWLGTLAFGLLMVGAPAHARCRSPLPSSNELSVPKRDIQLDDLARLRDIGPTGAIMFLFGSAFGVSPDGSSIAFEVRQADPGTNTYCQAIVVLELGSRRSKVIDQGGELIRFRFKRGPLADYYAGDAKLITPLWSGNGKRIAFLKRTGGRDQVWVAKADGSDSRQLTRAPVNVDIFAWAADGKTVIFQTRPAVEDSRKAIAREGLSGYLYDDRWSPVASNRPWPSEPLPSKFEAIDTNDRVRPATAAERNALEHPAGFVAPDGANWAASAARSRAWVAPSNNWLTFADGRIEMQRDGRPLDVCRDPMCEGNFRGLWVNRRGDAVWFLRREGWGKGALSLYTWNPADAAPRKVFTTRDLLLGCQRAGEELVCGLEQSTRPRRIVGINMTDGTVRELFDPNPEFGRMRLGTVERLEWHNDRQIEIYGDLVLPPNWTANSPPLPLIIVQYQTRGFLRGGTNDEFPIFPLAAEGFAVLSLERPGYPSQEVANLSRKERDKANANDWADRKSVLSAYRSGIEFLAQRGLVDPKRVGITGLSDGTLNAQFALASSNLFAAASLTSCCEDPKTIMPLLGNNGTKDMRDRRYPAYTDPAENFWSPYSIATNAAHFRTPLLMQSSDDEYLGALETYASLRDFKAPVELIVFPDEHHMKWQPAHRLAVYRRNIAWFSFWLQDRVSPFASQSEIQRWTAMRASAADSAPTRQ